MEYKKNTEHKEEANNYWWRDALEFLLSTESKWDASCCKIHCTISFIVRLTEMILMVHVSEWTQKTSKWTRTINFVRFTEKEFIYSFISGPVMMAVRKKFSNQYHWHWQCSIGSNVYVIFISKSRVIVENSYFAEGSPIGSVQSWHNCYYFHVHK